MDASEISNAEPSTLGVESEEILVESIDTSDENEENVSLGSGSTSSTPKESPRSPRSDEPPIDPSVICQACLIGDIDEVRTCLQNSTAANCQDAEGRTPLHAAAYSDEPQIVQMLIAAGAVVNAKDKNLLTPLHRACNSKSHEVLTILIASGADLNRKDKYWQTPLHIAANSGAVTCARFLIKAGALVDERDCHGRTPLHLAASLLPRVESAGDMCKLLIEKGHASLTVRDNLGRNPIHYATVAGNQHTFRVLCEAGARLDVSDSELFMPIHCAALTGCSVILSQIVRAGLIVQPTFSHQIEALTQGDQSPLHFAAAGGHVDCVQTLLQNGADPELQNASGATPVHYAAGALLGYDSMALLMKASSQPHKLVSMTDNHGRSPIHFAAFFGNPTRLKTLLRSALDGSESCACLDDLVCIHRAKYALQKDNFGLEPMHYAASQGNTVICKLLTSYYQFDKTQESGSLAKASKECDFVFPLLLASGSGSAECTKVLIDSLPKTIKNLDLLEDLKGRNCLHAACFSGVPDVVELLASSHLFADFNRGCDSFFDCSPIHLIASAKKRRQAAHCVKTLLSFTGDLLDPNQCDKLGRSALMIAAALDETSTPSVFNALLGVAQADPLTLDTESRSLLHYAAGNASRSSPGDGNGTGLFERCAISRILASPSVESPSNGSSEMCLLSPADAAELVDLALVGPQCNPLHIACSRGLAPNLAALVPLMPSLISAADEHGWTPLHYAAALTNADAAADCVQLLLAGGASVIAKECKNGWTPLHVAAYYGVASTVRILVDYVANSSENQLGSTFAPGRRPLQPEPATYINCRDRMLRTPLQLAISSKHRESVCVLLHRGADFRAKDRNRRSALHRAVHIGDTELVQWLSKAEPQSLFQKDLSLGRNVLHLAVLRGNCDVVDVIATACPKLILACDKDGISPLHLAAWRKSSPSPSAFSLVSFDDPVLNCLLAHIQPDWIEKMLLQYRQNRKLSPFHCAALADRQAAFDVLREAFFKNDPKAESEHLPNLYDSCGRTIFHSVFASGSLGIFRSLVHLLKTSSVSIQLSIKDKKRQWNPVQYGVAYGRIDLLRECRELLGEPGLVDLITDSSNLKLATSRGHENTALFLLETYCNVNGLEGVRDWSQSALKSAIKRGLVRVTEALLKSGVNPIAGAKAPIFSLCRTDSQVACMALALSNCGKQVKEAWGNTNSSTAQPPSSMYGNSLDDDEDENDNVLEYDAPLRVSNVDDAEDQFSPLSGVAISSADSGKGTIRESTGRKSSNSGYSDDGDFF